jgi:hypothetical protein
MPEHRITFGYAGLVGAALLLTVACRSEGTQTGRIDSAAVAESARTAAPANQPSEPVRDTAVTGRTSGTTGTGPTGTSTSGTPGAEPNGFGHRDSTR